MNKPAYLILGCGFTGSRVARLLAERGERVIVTTRTGRSEVAGVENVRLDSADPETLRALYERVPGGVRVLHSVPLAEGPSDPTPELLTALYGKPQRMVYLSTTGVYGATRDVDEKTRPAPRTPRERLRVQAETAVAFAVRSSMILRPAAIYGPFRGVHASVREGKFRLWGDGSNYVSRIHVDDLAALALAALDSEATGAWPVADERPCESREIAEYCARLFSVPLPEPAPAALLSETRRANRRVDGRAVCRVLGLTLRYPAYIAGIEACLRAEQAASKPVHSDDDGQQFQTGTRSEE